MGVPPVTLVGESWVSRMGLAVLTRVGLEHYAATDPAEYVVKALQSARDLDTLAALRSSLRERMITSPLCDPARLARDLEQAFRTMWRRWCRESVSP